MNVFVNAGIFFSRQNIFLQQHVTQNLFVPSRKKDDTHTHFRFLLFHPFVPHRNTAKCRQIVVIPWNKICQIVFSSLLFQNYTYKNMPCKRINEHPFLWLWWKNDKNGEWKKATTSTKKSNPNVPDLLSYVCMPTVACYSVKIWMK